MPDNGTPRPKYKARNRCGCTPECGLLTSTDEDTGNAVHECLKCGASWELMAERLVPVDFRWLGGPVIWCILPDSYPAICDA